MSEPVAFGKTGLAVSRLGIGTAALGDLKLSETEADHILRGALDAGISLIDTARSYGVAEARIGRIIAGRRNKVVLSTKVGYGIPGEPDWTGSCVTKGVEAALRAMRTEWIDIVHLHSCPVQTLQQRGVVESLHRAQQMGKIRVAAYSGDNEALDWAISSGAFGSVQFSLNPVDQRSIDRALPPAGRRGMGILTKRSLGNAPWRDTSEPVEPDRKTYWDRFQRMRLENGGMSWAELFLRFALATSGVHCVLFGARTLAHLNECIQAAARGPLPKDIYGAIRAAFHVNDANWNGVV